MSDEATAREAKRWDVPAIDGSDGQGYLTAGRLQELQKDAYEEAWQKGHAEGLEAASEEVARRAARFDELLRALCEPFDELDETVEKQLVELSMALVKQLFRREIKLDPGHIIGVVREAIQALPIASRQVQVHLHPEDAAMIRDSLTPAEGEPAWVIVEDPLTSKGGCRVTAENSQIDATAESRLHAVIGQCLGNERNR
ncbi:MAG: flagellar assembly protein FliH [Gammaproteobacteria bacterium]|nr:flagellar assembly protein FliH [Gammaproteobacteria bacterium]